MIARWVVLVGVGLVGLATATVSAVSLYELALACSIRSPLAAALPVAVDVAGTVGAVAWVTERAARVRAWGQVMAVTALLATLIGNGLAHSIAAGMVRPTLPLVLAVGAMIPLSLYAVVHLAAVILAGPRRAAPRTRTRPDPTPAASPGASAPSPVPTVEGSPAPAAGTGPTRLDERVAEFIAQRRRVQGQTKDETEVVLAEFGCSEPTLKRARRLVRERGMSTLEVVR